MDEQKNNQDLTVGIDGAMTEGASSTEPPVENTVHKPEAPIVPEPAVNTVTPPPSDETVKLPEVAPDPLPPSESSGVVKAPDDTASAAQTVPPPTEIQTTSDNVSSDTSATSSTHAPQVQKVGKVEQPHEHRNNKKLAVAMTIFIALALAGATVFVYVSAQDNATPEQQVIAPTTESADETLPSEDSTQDSTKGLLPETSTEDASIDSDSIETEEESVSDPSEPPIAPTTPLQETTPTN